MMKSRPAVSLAELLVVMSACSFILTMSASLIHRAMRAQSESRAFYDAQRSALRLARQFRHDVRRTESVSIGSGDSGNDRDLWLQLADGRTAEYSHADGEVLRVLSQPGGAVSREQFAFPSPIELDVRGIDSPPRLVLTLSAQRREPPGPGSMKCDLHVEASLNLVPNQGESL
jgi:hypothetical protein